MKQTIAIIGAGSWGTAVAIHLAHIGHKVLLWGHDPLQIELLQNERVNTRYLPGIPFPKTLLPITQIDQCAQAEYLIIAVPSHAFAEVLSLINFPIKGLSWITKGIDPFSHQLLSDIVCAKYDSHFPIAIISGPSFAKEVAQFMPTALTIASNNIEYQKQIHSLLHFQSLRVYLTQDIIGVQISGAVKNVLAIACGISDGLGYGANAKAALITRGLAEMTRLGARLGGQSDTFCGLAGMGDLVLTCTDNQSRNRRFGLLLGQGKTIDEALKEVGQVVEGISNCAQVCLLSKEYQLEMPICEQVNALLTATINVQQLVDNLMQRPAKRE